jgi:hypothetical protein
VTLALVGVKEVVVTHLVEIVLIIDEDKGFRLIKALKFKIKRLFIAFGIKKEQYSWFLVSNELNQGYALFRPSKKRRISYRQWKDSQEEEKELVKLADTINEFLDICETSDEYKAFVANSYKEQGYIVWEYNKDKDSIISDRLDLVLKRSKEILLVECRNCSDNIDMEQIINFEDQADKFIEKNQIFKSYSIKLRYTMSSLLLEEEAYDYIKNNLDKIDYDIIKLKVN